MHRAVNVFLITVAMAVIIHVLIIRPWYMRWGSTSKEVTMALPGDSLIDEKAVVSTRAITIHAPASAIWPWIAQIGQGRGGYYTYHWLENLFATQMVNADSIVPQWQHIQVGDKIYTTELQHHKIGDSTYFNQLVPPATIAIIEPRKTFVISGGWTFVLQPIDSGTTRLIVRYPSFPINGMADKLYYYPIFEPAHFITEAGMMMGIKQRSEHYAQFIKQLPAL